MPPPPSGQIKKKPGLSGGMGWPTSRSRMHLSRPVADQYTRNVDHSLAVSLTFPATEDATVDRRHVPICNGFPADMNVSSKHSTTLRCFYRLLRTGSCAGSMLATRPAHQALRVKTVLALADVPPLSSSPSLLISQVLLHKIWRSPEALLI